jgi:ParB family chromosome partitioning protein
MAAKRSALGKGLGALIPEVETVQTNDGVVEVDINDIEPNEEQPRKKFDDEKMQELAESIKEHGVVQPVIVKKQGDTYKLIAGERRWRAARIAGLKKIPVITRDFTEKEIMEISLIENIQREDLNPMEEALAYKKLLDEFKLTQEEISQRIGKSRPAVANILRLLNLDERVKNYVMDDVLSQGHARPIGALSDKNMQYEVAKKVIDESLNVRQTEKLVKVFLKGKKQKHTKRLEPHLTEIQEQLKNILGTKVSISYGRKKGKIEIEYYSNDDLQRIMDMFKL